MAHDVFISHSSKDKTIADSACAALENAAIRCWVAPRDVQPGRSFAGEIKRAIQNSKVMVLIFSAHSNNSDQVLREVQLAVSSHLHIVQFRIEDVALNDDLSYFLSTPHWLDALTPPLEAHIGRLTNSVRALLAEPPESAPAPPPLPRPVRKIPAEAAGQTGDTTLTALWISRGSSLWKERKPLVLAAAAVVILFLGWWLFHPRRVLSPPLTQSTPQPLPRAPVSSAPEIMPSVTPFIRPEDRSAMRAYEEWASQPKTAPTVNPQNELPVRRRFILQHDAAVKDANFSPDSKRIVTAVTDGTVRIWDVGTGKIAGEPLKCHGVTHATFSPDGKRILVVAGNIELWDADTGKALGEPFGKAAVASFAADGKRIATMDSGGIVQIWDTETRSPVGKEIRHKGGGLYAGAQFSPDGKVLLTTSENTTRIWNAESGEQIGDSLLNADKATFSPDGKRILTAPHSSGAAGVWDAQTGEKLFELDTLYGIYSLCFSPDGKYILTASQDYTARLWDAATGKQHGQAFRHNAAVWNAVFSPDSKRVATASKDGTSRLWDVETTQPLSKPLVQDNAVNTMRVHFSPDGKWLLTSSEDDAARLWEIGSDRVEPVKLTDSTAQGVAAPADAKTTSLVAPSSAPVANVNVARLSAPQAATKLGILQGARNQEIASAVAETTVKAMSGGDIESLVSLYGERVDYLDKGAIGTDVVRREFQQYFNRWPQTSWQMTGPVNVQPLDDSRYKLTFPVSFDAANPAADKRVSGNASETLVVARDASGAWKIVLQRETILRSGKSQTQIGRKQVKGERVDQPDASKQTENAAEIARQLRSLFPH
jgi:WD40 repeat protein